MNNYHKELLMEVVSKWTNEQLDGYIYTLQQRMDDTRALLKDLYALKKKRTKRVVDTGARGGL